MKEIHDFTILERRQLGESYFSLVLGHGGMMQHIAPGQFVELQVEGEPKVMLRRPISVHDVDEKAGTMTLLIQIVGNGTRRLAELKEGDKLNVVYPLGHGFSLDLAAGSRAVLVGGGAGTAPLLHLSKVLKAKGVDCTIILGGRTESLIPVRDAFAAYGSDAVSCNDHSNSTGISVIYYDFLNEKSEYHSEIARSAGCTSRNARAWCTAVSYLSCVRCAYTHLYINNNERRKNHAEVIKKLYQRRRRDRNSGNDTDTGRSHRTGPDI